MADSGDKLFQLEQVIEGALRDGASIDVAALAKRFRLAEADVEACVRGVRLVADLHAPEQKPPTLPDGFTMRGVLGRGGMGVVYRVYQPSLDREIALKMLHDPAERQEEQLERFRREAKALARLDHPGIARIHDVGQVDGTLYYTMAYVEGPDLDEVIKHGPCNARRAVAIGLQIADALGHAHRQGILHRDLKPANVVLGEGDRAVLVDFGLARRLAADRSYLTATGQVLGTPSYMSPEQVMGDGTKIDERTDVYGLGALLYRLLTGRAPVEDAPIGEMLRAVCDVMPPPANSVRFIPPPLAAICQRALAKRPDDRYASVQEMAEDLQRFRGGEPVRAGQRTVRGVLAPIGRFAKRAALPLLATVIGAIAAGAWFIPEYDERGRVTRRVDVLTLARDVRSDPRAVRACLARLGSSDGDDLVERLETQTALDEIETLTDAAERKKRLEPICKLCDARSPAYFGGATGAYTRTAEFRRRQAEWKAALAPPMVGEQYGIESWDALAGRAGFLAGDYPRLQHALHSLMGNEGGLLSTRPARRDPAHPAHLSSVGMLAGICAHFPDAEFPFSPFEESPRSLARTVGEPDALVRLVAARDRLPATVASAVRDTLRNTAVMYTHRLLPPETEVTRLAAMQKDTRLSMDARDDALALLCVTAGLPCVGDASSAVWARLRSELADAGEWASLPPQRRFNRRVSLALSLWEAWPDHDRLARSIEDWLKRFAGIEGGTLREARAAARRMTAPDDGEIDRLLDELTNGSKQRSTRFAHERLALTAARNAPTWPAGGLFSLDDVDRLGLAAAWRRVLGRPAVGRARLRVAVFLQDAPNAAHQLACEVVEGLDVGAAFEVERVLPQLFETDVPRGEIMGRDVRTDWLGRLPGDDAFVLRVHGRVLTDSFAMVTDRSAGRPRGGRAARRFQVEDYDVRHGPPATLSGFRVDRRKLPRCDAVVVFATIEPETEPSEPWGEAGWRARIRSFPDDPAASGSGDVPSRSSWLLFWHALFLVSAVLVVWQPRFFLEMRWWAKERYSSRLKGPDHAAHALMTVFHVTLCAALASPILWKGSWWPNNLFIVGVMIVAHLRVLRWRERNWIERLGVLLLAGLGMYWLFGWEASVMLIAVLSYWIELMRAIRLYYRSRPRNGLNVPDRPRPVSSARGV